VFVVVFAHEGVACAALNEAAVYDAGRMGEVFTRFQGRREPVCLKERAWALELFVPLCGPGRNEVLAGLGFLVREGDWWGIHCDFCRCFR